MSEDNYLSVREIFNEALIRDVILFVSLIIFSITQYWDTIFRFIFPLINFGFAMFFRILSTNKWRLFTKENMMIYNPMGSEKKHADRLNFCALLLLILLFWYGAESIYHPQLVDNYFPYFVLFFTFTYTFGYFWIFIDLWKFSGVKVKFKKLDAEIDGSVDVSYDTDILISYLSLQKYKIIAILSLIIFLIMNIYNLFSTILHFIPNFFNIPIYLPGTGIEGSLPIIMNFFTYVILILPPLFTIISLYYIYRKIALFSREELDHSLSDLPHELQEEIIENLTSINEKINK
ncbi:MAG: hypothetical protein P8Y97_14805 [Candidatus Lokiarchaeota archaeon]